MTISKQEILEEIEKKEFIEDCKRHGICPECGGEEFVKYTDIARAMCHRQFEINNTQFCIVCLPKGWREALENPHTTCDNCSGTLVCPHPTKGNKVYDRSDDIDDHNSAWGGAGPDCMIGRLETAKG